MYLWVNPFKQFGVYMYIVQYAVVQNFFGLKIFKSVWFLFPFVSDYGTAINTAQREIKPK